MALAPKAATNFMLQSGMLSYWAAGDLANIAKGSIDAGSIGIDGAWNKRDDTFQQAGEAVGEVLNTGAMAAANFAFLSHEASQYGWRNALTGTTKYGSVTEARGVTAKSGNMHVFHELDDGSFQRAGTQVNGKFTPITGSEKVIAAESKAGQMLSKSKYGGALKNGSKFVAGLSGLKGFWQGSKPFVYAMAAGYVARGVLGVAGSLVDQAQHDYHMQRSIHYDNRFFNTGRDQASAYQTLGMAMNNYENRMQSTARIFHSR